MGNPPAQNALLSPVMDSFVALERCIFRFCPLWNWSYHIGNGVPHLSSRVFQDNSTFSMLPRPIHISVFQNQNKGLDFWRYFVAVRVFINDRKIKFPTAESEKTKTFWIARFLSQKLFSNLHQFSKRQIRVKSVFANFKHNHGPNMLHMMHL